MDMPKINIIRMIVRIAYSPGFIVSPAESKYSLAKPDRLMRCHLEINIGFMSEIQMH